MLTDITIDFDLAQILGSDFDPRRTKAYVTTNVESGTLMDTSTGETRLGDEAVTIASDGTGSFTTWATGADGNPTSWQTSLVVDYPRTGQRDRKRRVFGPWTLTTADAGKNIVELATQQEIPAEYVTQVTDELQTYSDAAAASAADAAASAALADSYIVADLNTSDGQMEALIESPTSLTSAALSATFDAGTHDFHVDKFAAGIGTHTERVPFCSSYVLDSTDGAATTQDFVGHLVATKVTGDYTGVDSTNDGWLWGLNVYTHTETGATDGEGLSILTGALIEASHRGGATIGTVIGLQAEAAFMTASATGHIGAMMSMKVAQPKRKDGATLGDADYVYGLYIDSVPTAHLGATEAYSLFVAGGLSYFAGTVTVAGNSLFAESSTVTMGGVALTKQTDLSSAKALGVNSMVHASGLARHGDVTRRIVWGTGAPEGSAYASKGSLYLRDNGADYRAGIYLKTADASNTGWVPVRFALTGTGSPNGVVSGSVGEFYLRTDGGAGTTLYVKESGAGTNTGWVGK